MERHVPLLVACILTVLLAGCSGASITSKATQAPGAVKVTATSIAIEARWSMENQDSNCHASSGKVCHVVNVAIDNRAGEEDFETNMFYWKALDSDGGIYSAPDHTGADGIAAGSKGTATYSFDAPEAVRLVKLRYDSFTAEFDVSLPAY